MKKKTKQGKFKIRYIFLFIFLFAAFRTSFYEVFKIPSGSMIPSLMIGDFILVNKFAYGLKVPFSENLIDISLDKAVYLTPFKQPKRGDIIVFLSPQNTNIYMVKRLIGLPGDSIEIKEKVVYVNGISTQLKAIDGTKIMADMDDVYAHEQFKFYHSRLENSPHSPVFTYQVLDEKSQLDPIKYEIPPGEYFCMGDNRDHSYDSRNYGFVPEKYILGQAVKVIWSMIFPWNDHPTKHRPHRSGLNLNPYPI